MTTTAPVQNLIYAGTDHRGNSWTVTWYSPDVPGLVRFRKQGRMSKLLDRTALWDGRQWSAQRWRPAAPVVPDAIRVAVETAISRG